MATPLRSRSPVRGGDLNARSVPDGWGGAARAFFEITIASTDKMMASADKIIPILCMV